MAHWVALLRAINVGKRRYPMAELREVLDAAGFGPAETHIQTGNALVESGLDSAAELESALEAVFAQDRGFEVPTMCLRPSEVAEMVAVHEALVGEYRPSATTYVCVLKRPPSAVVAAAVEDMSVPGERLVVRGRAIHMLTDVSFHELRVNWGKVEKIAGPLTNRNANVMRALALKWAD